MPSTESPTTASSTRPISKLAIPFLGLLAGIQGSAPNISSTGLVSASRGLHMASGDVALAASIQSLTIAASVISPYPCSCSCPRSYPASAVAKVALIQIASQDFLAIMPIPSDFISNG